MLRLEPAVHRLDRDAEHAARERLFAMDGAQRMRQQEFDALVARAELERPHDAGAVAALIERELVGADGPFMRPYARRIGSPGLSSFGTSVP